MRKLVAFIMQMGRRLTSTWSTIIGFGENESGMNCRGAIWESEHEHMSQCVHVVARLVAQ